MVTGHLGIAMAARRRWPAIPVVLLLAASVFPDLVDLAKAVANIHVAHGLYSHTLPAVAVQTVVLGVITALWLRSPVAGVVVAALVALHLPADYITGDKLLWENGPIVGLDLYDRPLFDLGLEILLLSTCWALLRRSADAPRWVRSRAVLALLLFVQCTVNAIGVANARNVPLPRWADRLLSPVPARFLPRRHA
jgi:hypothetical protein